MFLTVRSTVAVFGLLSLLPPPPQKKQGEKNQRTNNQQSTFFCVFPTTLQLTVLSRISRHSCIELNACIFLCVRCYVTYFLALFFLFVFAGKTRQAEATMSAVEGESGSSKLTFAAKGAYIIWRAPVRAVPLDSQLKVK